MIPGVNSAHRRADGALVAAISFVILGVAPLISINIFAEKLSEVFSIQPRVEDPGESSVELAGARLTGESKCLAEVMYYEARGEGVDGEKAVAEVVLQRTHNPNYSSTVCGVIREGVEPGRRNCQFTFACDGSINRPREEASWRQVHLLAEKIMTGQIRLSGETGHAIAYHKVGISPAWAGGMEKTAQIGNHVFYRFMPREAAKTADAPKVQTASVIDNGV